MLVLLVASITGSPFMNWKAEYDEYVCGGLKEKVQLKPKGSLIDKKEKKHVKIML